MLKDSILLVEPDFPYPNKSKHKANSIHKNFVPIGLLKIGRYYGDLGHFVRLVRGNKARGELRRDYQVIMITTLFTYWSKYVWGCVEHYRSQYPKSKIILGGIYATLHHTRKDFVQNLNAYNAEVRTGLHPKAELCTPDYSLIENIDYHIMHGMRGCIRRCDFCGTWRIEPEKIDKTPEQIRREIKKGGKNKVIFFDNNFLANVHIKEVLKELAKIQINDKPIVYESQSGFDGRLLGNDPTLATLLKRARFNNVRIAWDNSLNDKKNIEKQLKHLTDAGFNSREISVFMIYNYNYDINTMIQKVKACFDWEVQISDCRYRPLDTLKDDYNPHKWRKGQTSDDYYIHDGWTDKDVRLFRKIVRLHNIIIRYVISRIKNKQKLLDQLNKIHDPLMLLYFYEEKSGYKKDYERWSAIHTVYKFYQLGKPPNWERIQKSKYLQDRIYKMKKVYNYCKKNSLEFSLKGKKASEWDKILTRFIVKNGLKWP